MTTTEAPFDPAAADGITIAGLSKSYGRTEILTGSICTSPRIASTVCWGPTGSARRP